MANLVAALPGHYHVTRAGERVNLRAVLQNGDKEKRVWLIDF